MSKICVPYKDDYLLPDPKYRLYSVTMKKSHLSVWNLAPQWADDDKIMDKFKQMQNWFNENYYEKYRVEFNTRTIFRVNNIPENIKILDENTLSVFLGIFLRAFSQIKGRKFRKDWGIICATGDLEYKQGEPLRLVSVGDVEKKYKDEFIAIADEKKEPPCLFLYISDKEEEKVPQGEKLGAFNNITVKWFSPDDTITDILEYLFEPYNYMFDFNFSDLDSEQEQLLSKMESEKENNYRYIPGTGFEELEREMLDNTRWRGFFLHGEGGSGKSATAMAIACYLVWLKRIYAPIWIRVDNREIDRILDKERAANDEKNEQTENESIKYLKSITEKKRDEIEEYIISAIETQIEQKSINSLKNSEKKYLIVVDNLQLQESDIKRIMKTLEKIYYNMKKSPYVIITSWFRCSDFKEINRIHLYERKAPELTENQIADFVKDIVTGTECSRKIDTAIENNTFNDLIDILYRKFSSFPDLIITAISQLRNGTMNVDKLTNEIERRLGGDIKSIREKRIQIYSMAFSCLNKLQKQMLYFFLGIGDDKLLSENDIYNSFIYKLNLNNFYLSQKAKEKKLFPENDIYREMGESEFWKKIPITKTSITEILNVLLDYNLIFSTERKKNNFYGIKNVPYHTFLFEKEFLHSDSETNDSLRDDFLDIDLQLKEALRYDQGEEVVKPLLGKLKQKGINTFDHHMFLSARCSSKPEILELLKDFGCNFNKTGIFHSWSLTPFAWACMSNPEISILDWFTKNGLASELDQSINKGTTVMHLAAGNNQNPEVLEWLFRHNFNLDRKDDEGDTVFHYAAQNDKISILEWLYKHAKKYLTEKNIKGRTVFHYAARNDNNAVLDWLYDHVPELLHCKDNYGDTAFFSAVGCTNIIALKWLYNRASELLMNSDYNSDYDGITAFHRTIMSGNIAILEWLYERNKELIKNESIHGYTVFHIAMFTNNLAILDWLFERVSELLNNKGREGSTVFHIAIAVKCDLDVLNWLYDHVPESLKTELLKAKDNNGFTVFHAAANQGNTAALDWLFAHASELLESTDNYGRTVCQVATSIHSNEDVWNWLFSHAPELFKIRDNMGGTVFHHAAGNGNVNAMGWLFKHVPELLKCTTNDGDSVVDIAIRNHNNNVIGWLLKYAPESCGPREYKLFQKLQEGYYD